MKKLLAIFCVIVMLTALFSACSFVSSNESTESTYSQTTEETFSDYEIAAEILIGAIKDTLKNPNSLIVNDILCYEINDSIREFGESSDFDAFLEDSWSYSQYVFAVDFSAENGFGGMARETHYYYYSSVGIQEDDSANVLIGLCQTKFQDQFRSIDISKLSY